MALKLHISLFDRNKEVIETTLKEIQEMQPNPTINYLHYCQVIHKLIEFIKDDNNTTARTQHHLASIQDI